MPCCHEHVTHMASVLGTSAVHFHPQAEASGKGMVIHSVVAHSVMLPIAAWLQPAVGRDNTTRPPCENP